MLLTALGEIGFKLVQYKKEGWTFSDNNYAVKAEVKLGKDRIQDDAL